MQKNNMQTVLVAGGAGFIGSHLCQKLLESNYQVICVDNLITGAEVNITPLLTNPNFTFINANIVTDIDTITNQLAEVQYMFHLASPASPNEKSPRSYIAYPIETLEVNSVGTHKL